MNFVTYAPLARRTLKVLPYQQHLIHMALGLCGEVGEIIDAIKKFAIYEKGVDPSGAKDADGKPLVVKVADGGVIDKINLMEELGDVCWYFACLLDDLQIHPAAVDASVASGYAQGSAVKPKDVFETSQCLLALGMGIYGIALTMVSRKDFKPGGKEFSDLCAALGESVGFIAGTFNLDMAQVLERNIAKLAKRYGDKYSDLAATNRDTAAERLVLEAGDKAVADAVEQGKTNGLEVLREHAEDAAREGGAA